MPCTIIMTLKWPLVDVRLAFAHACQERLAILPEHDERVHGIFPAGFPAGFPCQEFDINPRPRCP